MALMPGFDTTLPLVRDGDTWTVEVPLSLLRSYEIAVNGEFQATGKLDWNSPPMMVSGDGPNPHIEIYRQVNVATRYRSVVDSVPDMSAKDYVELRDALATRAVRGEDGERRWPEITDEVAAARLARDYTAEYRTVRSKVGDATLVEAPVVPETPFLTLGRHVGKGYMSSVVVYHRPDYVQEIIRQRLEGAGLCNQSGINHIDNRGRDSYSVYYLSGKLSLHLPGGYRREQHVGVVQDLYPKVVELMAKDRAMVEGWVSGWLRNVARPFDTVEVIEQLRVIAADISRVQGRSQAERSLVTGARRKVAALIDKLDAAPAPAAGGPEEEERQDAPRGFGM